MSIAVRIVVIFLSVLSSDNSVIISSIIDGLIWPLTWDNRSIFLILNRSFSIRLFQMALTNLKNTIIIRSIINSLWPRSSPMIPFHCHVNALRIVLSCIEWSFFSLVLIKTKVLMGRFAQNVIALANKFDRTGRSYQ